MACPLLASLASLASLVSLVSLSFWPVLELVLELELVREPVLVLVLVRELVPDAALAVRRVLGLVFRIRARRCIRLSASVQALCARSAFHALWARVASLQSVRAGGCCARGNLALLRREHRVHHWFRPDGSLRVHRQCRRFLLEVASRCLGRA